MLEDYRYDKPTITTDRLILRSMVPEDAEDLREWFGLEEVYTYWGRKATLGEREPERLFLNPRPRVKKKPSLDFCWAVVLKENSKVIGVVEIFDIENCRMGDVAYRFHPKYWGKGFATESMTAAIEFIFSKTEMKRLNGAADVRNIASNRVLEKCGFIREGTIRQGKMVRVYCDYHIYGLLVDDIK